MTRLERIAVIDARLARNHEKRAILYQQHCKLIAERRLLGAK